jgi:threonine/homoserine/homoserine lactone efflux protein
MTVVQSLLAFTLAAILLTITPGPDTALVVRAAAAGRARTGVAAALGISIGCLTWGALVALGLGAVLAASHTAYTVLKLAGGAYLIFLGLKLILKPRSAVDLGGSGGDGAEPRRWLMRGLMTNLLNPKIGVFYVSFLPQFVPHGVPAAPWVFGLAAFHVAISVVWFALLIAMMRPLRRVLERPPVVRWLDRCVGVVFTGFGLRLALSRGA